LEVVAWDLGSSYVKEGIAGDDSPRNYFKNAIGTPMYPLSLSYPINHGIVTDWDAFDKIISHTMSLGKVQGNEHPLIVSEAIFNPFSNREKMSEIIYEKHGFMAFYVSHAPVLALYASGSTTGLIVNCGGGVTSVAAFMEGVIFRNATNRMFYGGDDLTLYLMDLLNKNEQVNKGYIHFHKDSFNGCDIDAVRDIKEKCCSMEPKFYHGQYFEFFKQVPEAIFDPSLMNNKGMGIVDAILDSLQKIPIDLRTCLSRDIVIEGGSTIFPGFAEELHMRLKQKLPTTRVDVISPPERKFSVWIGLSILGSLSAFKDVWITKEVYHEVGPNIMKNCF